MATIATYVDTGSTFSPSAFRASFKDGLARPSLFHLKLIRYPNIFFKSTGSNSTLTGVLGLNNILPTQISSALNNLATIPPQVTSALNIGETIYQNLNSRGLNDLVFRCSQVLLPEKNIETYTTKTYGPSQEFPREIENGRIQTVFLGSGTYYEHDIFSTWMDKCLDYNKSSESPSYSVAYYDDIISEANVVSYDENGNPSYLQTFEEIYPVSVGGIEYDWNRKNEVVEFPVVFAFKTMKTEKIAKGLKNSSQLLSRILTATKTLTSVL